ncbi:putative transcriptional regulatory protein [Colletotrichum orbiculare MAFF 240422]|uniref:Transcriptional regulatory protein n=1 Tax=Colletotrichum orbiculare (strain 104-T / ATCC 96160 / CBS 514.97 / LARS 414 / MAFF 240422) TaxID=1213857 RepID=N4V5R8_COLOR|nr:putative transcriptional regulatory protein [Colletotrichum orbiculare MAFF 240422]
MPSSYDDSVPTPADSRVEPTADATSSSASASGETQAAKRRRINFACNYCRNRKTRCDEQKPSCRACIAAGIECVTTDRRRPGIEVQRRETKRRASRIPSSTTSAAPHSGVSASASASTSAAGPYASPLSSKDTDGFTADGAAGVTKSSPSIGDLGHDDVGFRRPSAPTPRASVSTTTARPDDEGSPPPPAPSSRPKYQGKLPAVRPSRGSTSVEILADWLDLASRRLGLQHHRGLPPSASASNPSTSRNRIRAILSSKPCRFPPAAGARLMAERFFDGINVLFPLLNRERFAGDIELALDLTPTAFAEARGIAVLAQLYIVWAIGFAAEPNLDPLVDPKDYLDYCKTLLGHLVINNTVENVRAIVLLAFCLHCYDDCAGAWNTLSVGVSMATAMGLHRPRTCRRQCKSRKPDALDDEERRFFWLGIYAYEKFFAFEMGRLSLIDDDDCYAPHVQHLPTYNETGTSSKGKAFAVIVDLARILSEIGRKSVIVSRKEDGVTGAELQAVVIEKVQTTGEAKLLLTRWGESVPDELRPTSDIMIGSRICPFASYISMHYNCALVILSRNSLLISEEAITNGANAIAKGKPWDYIVRNGPSIAANAARKMLRILVETLDSQSNAVLPSLLCVLEAFTALAVHIVTHPDSRISTMDFYLMQTASELMKEFHSRLRGDNSLNALLQKIDGVLAQQARPPPARLGTTPILEAKAIVSPADADDADNDDAQHVSAANAGGFPTASVEQGGWPGQGGDRVAPNMSEAALFNHNYIMSGGNDFGYGTMGAAMPMAGDEWSPGMSDGVGWDWSCFSHLLTDEFQPQ